MHGNSILFLSCVCVIYSDNNNKLKINLKSIDIIEYAVMVTFIHMRPFVLKENHSHVLLKGLAQTLARIAVSFCIMNKRISQV